MLHRVLQLIHLILTIQLLAEQANVYIQRKEDGRGYICTICYNIQEIHGRKLDNKHQEI